MSKFMLNATRNQQLAVKSVAPPMASDVVALREKILEAALTKSAERRQNMVGNVVNGSGPGMDLTGAWWIGSLNTTVLTVGGQRQLTIRNPVAPTPGSIQIGNPDATVAADTTTININGTVTINGASLAYGDAASTSIVATQYTPILTFTLTNNTSNVTYSGGASSAFSLPVGMYDISWRANVGAGSPSALQLALAVFSGTADGVSGAAANPVLAGSVIARTAAGNNTAAATPTPLQVGSRNLINVTVAAQIVLVPITATVGQTLALVNGFSAEVIIRSVR